MSLDILTNSPSEVSPKKKSLHSETSKESEKKESFSLFDSIMKDIQSEGDETSNTTLKTTPKNSVQKSNEPVKSFPVGNSHITHEVESATSRQVADKLVDLMVDNIKEKKTKLAKEAPVLGKVETKNSLHEKIELKTVLIKEAAEEIKEEVKNLLISKDGKESKESKDTKGIVQPEVKNPLKGETNPLQEKIELKTTTIKKAVEEIKEEVKNLLISKDGKESKESKDTKGIVQPEVKNPLKGETNPLQEKIELKTTTIKKAVEEIKEEIKTFISSDVKLQELENQKQENVVTQKESKKEMKNVTTQEIIEAKIQFIKETTDEIKKDVEKISGSNNLPEDKVVIKQTPNPHQTIHSLTQEDLSSLETPQVDGKTSLLANGFLNSQQHNKQTVALTQIAEAKKKIENNKTVQSVKESASMLDLKPEKIEIEHSSKETEKVSEQKADLTDRRTKENQLMMMQNSRGVNRFLLDKNNLEKNNLEKNNNDMKLINEGIQKNTLEGIEQKEKNIVLNVPQNVVESIQNKIIGAQQKMGNFMSEVARNMYLNYKPPFTALRMNLNPENLGTIAIVMRASKTDNNNVTVSMNLSSNSTMEAFVENKAALQNALQRQLGESSNVTLNFDMQDNQSNSQFNQSNQNNGNSQYQSESTGASSEDSQNILVEEEGTEELNYM